MSDKTYTSYPSLYSIGHKAVANIFFDEVTVEEKVDGSQFSFGVTGGVLQCRSKRCILADGAIPDLFAGAVATAQRLFDEGKLPGGYVFRGEAIQRPKHNTLAYDRVPHGNVVVFDIMLGEENYLSYDEKHAICERLGLECAPLFFRGNISSHEQLESLLERVSFLGGNKIEGFVVKNYSRFGMDKKPLFAKFVSPAFKEVHQGDWKERNPKNGDIIQRLIDKYRTPARWDKAIQHLRDDGRLTDSPKDIGPVIVECQADILKECGDDIREELFKWAWKQIACKVVGGLPQWYRDKLFEEKSA